MDAELTLKLNQEIIKRAKEYASRENISLSRLIETYLHALTKEDNNEGLEISPFVRSLATGVKIPGDLDYKKEYSDHLKKKYK